MLSAALNALPCFYLGVVLLWVWVDPMAWDNGRWVPFGIGIVALEFLVLHSGAFLGGLAISGKSRAKRTATIAVLVLLYALMAWGFALATDSSSLLTIFLAIMAARIMTIVVHGKDGSHAILGRAVVGSIAYLLLVFASILLPVPALGVTETVLDAVYPGRGDGIWEEEPHRALAAGGIYFIVIGIFELWLFRPGSPAATKVA